MRHQLCLAWLNNVALQFRGKGMLLDRVIYDVKVGYVVGLVREEKIP